MYPLFFVWLVEKELLSFQNTWTHPLFCVALVEKELLSFQNTWTHPLFCVGFALLNLILCVVFCVSAELQRGPIRPNGAKKSCSWNIKTHYLRFKHFIITITDDPGPC
jgi:hypothetical protein